MESLFDQICAYSNLLAAFDRVEENRGGPGCDGVTIDEFALGLEPNLLLLQRQLREERYKPLPLLRIYLDKDDGGQRPLSIPALRDRIAQTAAALVLTPILDPEFEDASYGYRPGRSVDQALDRILALRDSGYRWIVDADIKRFFEEVSHDQLVRQLGRRLDDQRLLGLIELWLKAEIEFQGDLWPQTKGLPQGSPLSPLLANFYLDPFDRTFLKQDQKLIRYADDFVILCATKPSAEKALELTEEALAELRLSLNRDETGIRHFEGGFQFLGVQFLRSLAFRPLEAAGKPSHPASPQPVSPRPPTSPARPSALPDTRMAKALEQALDRPHAASSTPDPDAEDCGEAPFDDDSQPLPSGHDPLLRTLYLVSQGTLLGRESERFVIRQDGRTVAEVPALKVDQIVVLGNVSITTPAMQ